MSHDHAMMTMTTGTDSAMNHMSMPSNGSSGHMMMMYFHTELIDYVLFKPLYVTTVGGMVGACIVIFVLGVLYEGLKVLREHLLLSGAAANRRGGHNGAGASFVPDGTQPETYVPKGRDVAMLSSTHAIQTALHAVQITVSYILMLVFMTYSVWLCIAVVLGSTVGYFLFGWLRRTGVDISEHCH